MASEMGGQPQPSTVVTDPEMEARRAEAMARTVALRAEFQHELGVPYGDHPRQVMDLYYPASPAQAPVLVFLHGGGFRVGEPGRDGYVGRPMLERGGIFVSMGYRLLPEVSFPNTCEDVERGLDWLRHEIAARGGAPERIYLSGHSAGAMLAAWVGLRPTTSAPSLPPDLVKGLVLISGMYDLTGRPSEAVDPASPRYVPRLYEALERVPEHTILVVGEHDFPQVPPDARSLAAAIRARGGTVELFVEPNADHFVAHRSFVSAEGQVFLAAARMMRLS
jgi:arylformamidase